jgi:hypothetical protein
LKFVVAITLGTMRNGYFAYRECGHCRMEGAVTRLARNTPTGLNELQISRLFKCAVKDDEMLVDAIVERLYRKMKEIDAKRADNTIGLIVDRDATAASTFGAFLDEAIA